MQTQPGLTPEQIALLEMPFRADEHAFVKGKGVYLRKSAIRRRLSQVDPGWSISEPVLLMLGEQVVVMSASITISGVTRGGLGTGVIGQMDQPFKQAAEIAKALKTAASDCLPRAAAQFGVGDYLNELARDQKADEQSLQRWLASQNATAPVVSTGPAPRAATSTPPARSGKAAWAENPDAVAALERRLRNEIADGMTLEWAEELLKRSLFTFTTSDAALKAVAQAYADYLRTEPA